MSKEGTKIKTNVKSVEKECPINHRIRPDDMTIMEAARIGRACLKKDPNYKQYLENIRIFDKSDGE